MTRGKVKLAFIVNNAQRRQSFQKRKKGAIKKAEELKTLCDSEGCVIIPASDENEQEIWPSSHGAQQVISRYRDLPEDEQTKRMDDQESYTNERIQKLIVKEQKLKRHNESKEIEILLYELMAGFRSLDDVPLDRLKEIQEIAEKKIQEMVARGDELQRSEASASNPRT